MSTLPAHPSAGGDKQSRNLALVGLVSIPLGLFWIGVLASATATFGDSFAVVWVAAAVALAVPASDRMRRNPSRVWWLACRWWLQSLIAPVALVYELIVWRHVAAAGREREMAETVRLERLEQVVGDVERRLQQVEDELARRTAPAPAAPPREPERPPRDVDFPRRREPAEPPASVLPPSRVRRPATPPPPEPERRVAPAAARAGVSAPAPAHEPPPTRTDWSELLGARALAIVGGLVTLLGIVFFFVLAVDRGWIGPSLRVTFGALASAAVFGAAWFLRRRYGDSYAALAAAGAGIAGGYGTLLFAAARYELVPDAIALVIAAAIAAVGVATALLWSAELVAAIGLLGAIAVPALALLDGPLTAVGTAFVAIMLAAGGAVAVVKRWRGLLVVVALAALPHVAGYAAKADTNDVKALVLSGIFLPIVVALGIADQLRDEGTALRAVPSAFITAGALLGTFATFQLLAGVAEGVTLLGLATAYAALAAAFFPRPAHRDLSMLLSALALTLAAGGAADLASGPTLVYLWAAEAAALAWLAWRTGEIRFQAATFVYFGLALGHVLALDAPLRDLFVESAAPAAGVPAVVAAAVAAAVWAFFARPWPGRERERRSGFLGNVDAIFDALRAAQQPLRTAATWLASILAVYAGSLLVLGVAVRWFDHDAFDWGEVGVDGLWGLVGLTAIAAALLRSSTRLEIAGFAALAAVVAKAGTYDVDSLEPAVQGYALLVSGAAVLAGSFLYESVQRRWPTVSAPGGIFYGASACLAAGAVHDLVEGVLPTGAALVFVAGVYAALATVEFVRPRRRDHSTVLWSIALAFGIASSFFLLDGTWLVLAWIVAAAGLTVGAGALREPRFLLAAVAPLVLAATKTLVQQAPPRDFFLAGPHPGAGVPSLLLLLGGVLLFVRALHNLELEEPKGRPPEYRRLVADLSRGASAAVEPLVWAAAPVALYTLSLAVLELFEQAFGGNVDTAFQRGHTAVSACWGVIGLALLYSGLMRRARPLRLGGFALFGISLAKIFLYDLAALSSVARALSFLAVGAVLLLGGFFYQRLGSGLGTRSDGHGEAV